MQKKNIDIGDCVALIIAGMYTWMIYHSNTPSGTRAQTDFVAWFTVALLLLSVFYATLDDATILRSNDRHPNIKAFVITNNIVQILLFVATAHFWLFAIRLLALGVMHGRVLVARERAEEAANSSRAP